MIYENFFQAFIVSFREGLEAFLIIAILLKFLDKTNNSKLKKSVWQGTYTGILASLVFGYILILISASLGGSAAAAKLWESIASFSAVVLITTFIVWMIHHGATIKQHIESEATLNLTKKGIFLLAFMMVVREGAEIAIFSFAGDYSFLPILVGIFLSIFIAALIHYSLVRIQLKTIFNLTLAYLILQAGFLIGYSIHEGLSAAKEVGIILAGNPLFIKAFDLSSSILNHKEGIIGMPMYVLVGWYSKPEWIQLFVQYGYTFLLFWYWKRITKKNKDTKAKEASVKYKQSTKTISSELL